MPAEKVRCACGCYVGKFYMNKHKKTKKHLKLLEINQPPTLDNIMKAMNELEKKIDDMSSGEYLLECNRLKSIYDRLKRTENMRVDNNDILSIIMILFG
jgi:hypothetical protein